MNCPIPLNWTPVPFSLAKPAGVTAKWPYHPTVLRRADGSLIDLRTVIPGFPYKHVAAWSTDHTGGSDDGLYFYFFDDDPSKLVSWDDAYAAGAFDNLSGSFAGPTANPVLDYTDAAGAISQLETPEISIHPVTGKILVTGHTVHSSGQYSHRWEWVPASCAFSYLGRVDSFGSDTGTDHTGYLRDVTIGGELTSISLRQGTGSSIAAIWEDDNSTGIGMSLARTITDGFDVGPRKIALSSTQILEIDGMLWGVARRLQNGAAGGTIGNADVVVFPWRHENVASAADKLQALGGEWYTLSRVAGIGGSTDGEDGWMQPHMLFTLNGEWWGYGVVRNEAGTANTGVLLKGSFDSPYGGIDGRLMETYGQSYIGWPRIIGDDVICTDGIEHGTIEGTVATALGPVATDPAPAVVFDDNASNRVNLGDLAELGRIIDDYWFISFFLKTSDTGRMQIGSYGTGAGVGIYFDLNFNSVSQSTGAIGVIVKGANGERIVVHDTANTGFTDGNWHRFDFRVAPAADDVRIWLDGTERTSLTVTVDESPTPFDDMTYDWLWGCRTYNGTQEYPFNGTLTLPRIIRRNMSEQEIAAFQDLVTNGVAYERPNRHPAATHDVSTIATRAIKSLPDARMGTNGGLPTVDANNRVAGIQGTTNTLDELDAAQDFQHTTTRMAVAGIASEVWNEELAGNTDSGTIGGELLGAVGIGSKISSIQTAIGTPAGASVSADIASIKTDTGTTIPAAVAAVPGQVAADAAGILTDTNQERIPPSRVWKVVPTTDEGLVGESTKSVNLDSDPATFAVDFSEDIYANGVIAIVADPVIKEGTPGGVTFSSKGRLGAQARFQITLLTAGTYKIRVLVTYDNGSTANAEVTLRVVN